MGKKNKGAVLITGTSSGIGQATALLLDREGYRVFAGVRKQEDGERLKAEASDRLTPLILDITLEEQREEALRTVSEAQGELGLAGLVNNAGIAVAGPLEFLPLAGFRRHLDVNAVGHLAMIQQFLPLIRKGRGRIVNVASANCRFAFPYFGGYAASKFALRALSDSLRQELRPWKIPVIVVEPGTVEAPIWDNAAEASEKLLASLSERARELYGERIAKMAAFMYKGRDVAFPTEKIAEVIHRALTSWRPRPYYRRGPGSRMSLLGGNLPARLTDFIVANVIEGKLSSKFLGW